MTDLSAETGIAIDELHRIFSGDENNTLEVMLCVLDALGVKLTAVSQHEGSVWPANLVL